MQETLVQLVGQEDLLEKGWVPTPGFLGFPCGSAGKDSACNVGDLGLIPGLRRPPGEEGKSTLPIPVFWPSEFHRLYSPWGPKGLDTTE